MTDAVTTIVATTPGIPPRPDLEYWAVVYCSTIENEWTIGYVSDMRECCERAAARYPGSLVVRIFVPGEKA